MTIVAILLALVFTYVAFSFVKGMVKLGAVLLLGLFVAQRAGAF